MKKQIWESSYFLLSPLEKRFAKMWNNAIILINGFCFGEYSYLYNNIIYVNLEWVYYF